MVAVSTYPPDLRRATTEIPKFANLVHDCGATVAITCPAFMRASRAARLLGHTMPAAIKQWVVVKPSARVSGERCEWDVDPARGDTAFIQYTSGSSGSPKGCVVTHSALRYCLGACSLINMDCDTMVSWVPQYHDCT